MSHFALLWKARAIERYRKNYEQEKMHSIMMSNAKMPKRSFIQRIRHMRYNCKKRMTRLLRACCPKGSGVANFFVYLKTDQTFPNFILKSIIGFMGGFVLTYMFFMFFVFQLSISLAHATVMCSVIGVLLTLGLAFSYRVRCLVFLLIPQFFSEVGRYTLIGYALILILTGPAKNTLHNSEVLSESMACGQEQLKAGVRLIQESITKPFNSMKETIHLMVDSVKEVAAKIKETLMAINRMVLSIVRVIQSAFSWLSSVVSVCNKKLGTPSQRCHTALEDGVLDCRARLGPYFAWLCSVAYVGKVACYAARALDVMCVLVDFVSGTVVATIKRKLRTFSNHVKTMLFVSVRVRHSYSFSSNSSRSAGQVAAGIVTEIRHRADRLLQLFSWMSCITSLFLLLIIFRAKYYQHMYETRSRYDNRYVTRELRELDLRRARESRDTVLPLNRRERARYVTTTSFRLVASERLSIARSAIFLSITTFKLLIHMAADYSLYWVLMTIRYHGRFETPPMPAAPDGGVLVSGVGPLAAMLRGLVAALAAPLSARPVAAPVACLPDPSPPDTQRYMQISILIVLLWTFAIFEPYGLRLRHAVMAHYRPERARARAVWLYNHILRSRGGFLKIARRKLHRNYKLQPHDKYTFRQWLDSVIPCWWLRSLLGTSGRGLRCLLCSVAESPDEPDSKLVKCESAGCVGVYCVSCFNDIGRLCTICLSPADYGDVSDISLERGSTEESESPDTNTTDMESAVDEEDFEKAPEWHSTENEDDEDSSPRIMRNRITQKIVKFINKRGKEKEKPHSSDYSQDKGTMWDKFFKRGRKRNDHFDEERERLLEERKKLLEEEEMLVKDEIIKKRDHNRDLESDVKKLVKKPREIPKPLLVEGEEKVKDMSDNNGLLVEAEEKTTGPMEGEIEDLNGPITVAGIDTEKIDELRDKLVTEMEEKQEKKKEKKKKGKAKKGEDFDDLVEKEDKKGLTTKATELKTENIETTETESKPETPLLGDKKVNVAHAKMYYFWNKNKSKTVTCVRSDNSGEAHSDTDSDSNYESQCQVYVCPNGARYNYSGRNTLADCVSNTSCCNGKPKMNNNKDWLKCYHDSIKFGQKTKFESYDSEKIWTDRKETVEISSPKRGLRTTIDESEDSFVCSGRGRNIKIPCPIKGFCPKKKELDNECMKQIKKMVIAELKQEGEIWRGSPKRRFYSRKGADSIQKPYWKERSSRIGPCGDNWKEFKRYDCKCPKDECHKNVTSDYANKETPAIDKNENSFQTKTRKKRVLSDGDSTYLLAKERENYMRKFEQKDSKNKTNDIINTYKECQCCLSKDVTEDCGTQTFQNTFPLFMKRVPQTICHSRPKICKIKVKDQEIQTDIDLTDIEFSAVCHRERKKENKCNFRVKKQNKEKIYNQCKETKKDVFRDERCQKNEYKNEKRLGTIPICESRKINKIMAKPRRENKEMNLVRVIKDENSCPQTKVIKPKRRILCIRRKRKKIDGCVPCRNRKTSGTMKVIVFNKEPRMCVDKKVRVKNNSRCRSIQLGRYGNFDDYPEQNESASVCCSKDLESHLNFYKAPIYKTKKVPSKLREIAQTRKSSSDFKTKKRFKRYTECQNRLPVSVQSDQSNFDIDSCECPEQFHSEGSYQLCRRCSQKSLVDLCESVNEFSRAVCQKEKTKRKRRSIFRKRNRNPRVCVSYLSSTHKYQLYRSKTWKMKRPPFRKTTRANNKYTWDKDWYRDIYQREMGFDPPDEVRSIHKLAIAYDQLMAQSNLNKYEKKYTSHPRAPKHAQGPWVEGYEWPAGLATPRCLCPQEICSCGLRKPPEEVDDVDQYEFEPMQRTRTKHGFVKMKDSFPRLILSLFRRGKKVGRLAGQGNLLPRLERALTVEQGRYEKMTSRGDPLDTMPTDCLARCHKYYDKVTKHIVDDIALDYGYQLDPDEAHRKRNEQRLQEMIKTKDMGKQLASRVPLGGRPLHARAPRDDASLQDFSDGRTPVGWTHTLVSPDDTSADDGVAVVLTPVCGDDVKCKKAVLHSPHQRPGQVQFALRSGPTPRDNPIARREKEVHIELIDPQRRRASAVPDVKWVDFDSKACPHAPVVDTKLSHMKQMSFDSLKTGAASIVKNLQRCASTVLRWTNWLEPDETNNSGIDVTVAGSAASEMARSVMGLDPILQDRGQRRPSDEVKLDIELEGAQGASYLCRPLRETNAVVDDKITAVAADNRSHSLNYCVKSRDSVKSVKERNGSVKSDKRSKGPFKSDKKPKQSIKTAKSLSDSNKSAPKGSVKVDKGHSGKSDKNPRDSFKMQERRDSSKSDKIPRESDKERKQVDKSAKGRKCFLKSDKKTKESFKSDEKSRESVRPLTSQQETRTTGEDRTKSVVGKRVSVVKVEKASSPIAVGSAEPGAVSVARLDRGTGSDAARTSVHPLWGGGGGAGRGAVWEEATMYSKHTTETWTCTSRTHESVVRPTGDPASPRREKWDATCSAHSDTSCTEAELYQDNLNASLVARRLEEEQGKHRDRREYLVDTSADTNQMDKPVEQDPRGKKTFVKHAATHKKYPIKDEPIRRSPDRRDYLMDTVYDAKKQRASTQNSPPRVYSTSFTTAHRMCKDCAAKAIRGHQKNICIQCRSCQLHNRDRPEERREKIEENARADSLDNTNVTSKKRPIQKNRYIPHNTDAPAKCFCRKCHKERNLCTLNLDSSPECSYRPKRTVKIGPDGSKTPENRDHRVKERMDSTEKYGSRNSARLKDRGLQYRDGSGKSQCGQKTRDECARASIDRCMRRLAALKRKKRENKTNWKKTPAWCRDRHEKRRWRHIDGIIPPSKQDKMLSLFHLKEIPRSSHSTSLESEMRITSLDIAEKGTSVGGASLAAKRTWLQKFRKSIDHARVDVGHLRKSDISGRNDRTTVDQYRNVIVTQECERTPLCTRRVHAPRKIPVQRWETTGLDIDGRGNVDVNVETRLPVPPNDDFALGGKFSTHGNRTLQAPSALESLLPACFNQFDHASRSARPPSVETLSPEKYTMMSASPGGYEDMSGLRDFQYKFEPVQTSSPAEDAAKWKNDIWSKDASPILHAHNCGFFEMMHRSSTSKEYSNGGSKQQNEASKETLDDKSKKISPKKLRARRPPFVYTLFKKKVSKITKPDSKPW